MSEGCTGAACTSISSSPASGCRGCRDTRLTESPGSPNLVSCSACMSVLRVRDSPQAATARSWPPGQHLAELHELAVEGRVGGGRGEHQAERRDSGLARGLGATHVAEPGPRGAVVVHARAEGAVGAAACQV